MKITRVATGGVALILAAAVFSFAVAHRRGVRHRFSRVVSLLLTAAPLPAPQQQPQVSGAVFANYHPRILINRDLNRADLQKRASGPLRDDFAALRKLLTRDGLAWNFCNVNENVEMSMVYAIGYMYQMTGDARFADKLIDGYLLKCFDPVQGTRTDDPGFALELAAISFDWTYDRITQRDAAEPGFKQRLIEKMKAGYKAVADDVHLFREDVRESDFHNYTVEYENGYLMMGLALYNEDPLAPEMIQRGWGMIAEGYAFQPTTFGETFQYNLKASIDMTGGAMNWEGPIYWRAAVPEILRAIEAYDTASNRRYNAWSRFANTVNGGYYKIYMLRPNGTTPGLADSDPGQKPSWKDNFALAILLDRFKDGHIKHFIDNTQGGWYGGYGAGLVFKLLYYDSRVPDKNYNDLPLGREFGREIVMRSGWGPSDTFITFTAGTLGYYHNHLDENAFTVFRYGDLATDGGYVLTQPYYTNYFKRTVAHNAITVFDPSECWRDNTPDCSLSNDGGQRWPLRRFTPPFQKNEFGINRLWSATVLADPLYREQFLTSNKTFESRLEYDYVKSDATRAYTNQWSGQGHNTNRRVELAQRELVFVRPDFVFILDRVVSTNPSFQKSWLLHSAAAPRVRINGEWRTPGAGITAYEATRETAVESGDGRMFVTTLAPPSPRIRVIGGPGFEGWVNGRNYWAPAVLSNHGPIGQWRIEVQPSRQQNEDLFLHFLFPTKEAAAPAVSAIDSPTASGGVVENRKSPLVVVFSKKRGAATSQRYTASHSGKALHVVLDLTEARYDIYRSGIRLATAVAASPQGSLSFTETGGGEIVIVPTGTNP